MLTGENVEKFPAMQFWRHGVAIYFSLSLHPRYQDYVSKN